MWVFTKEKSSSSNPNNNNNNDDDDPIEKRGIILLSSDVKHVRLAMDFHERGKDLRVDLWDKRKSPTERRIILTFYATPFLVIWYNTFSSQEENELVFLDTEDFNFLI